MTGSISVKGTLIDKYAFQKKKAAARDDQHEYVDRSLRETDHVSSRAVPGAPPPLEKPNSGRWIILDF